MMKDYITSNIGQYSVPDESRKLLQTGILKNSLITRYLPAKANQFAHKIRFVGSKAPSIPVNWRFAESVAAVKGLEAIMINALLKSKYDLDAQEIIINTDHAQLFIVSCLLTSINGAEKSTVTKGFDTTSIFPSYDIYRNSVTPYRTCAGNIYRTKDERYFHLHSDLNPNIVQDALGLPHDADGDYEKASKLYQEKVAQYTADELDDMCAKQLKTSGTTAWTVDEYKASEHGKANAHVGLWELHEHVNVGQLPCWWPSSAQTSPVRPLAGLKVVDFSRIIATPTLTRGLAELGASVMRITSPHLPEMGFMHPDMGWGKWNTHLDFRKPEDVKKAKELILEADVVVCGFRPNVLDKYGLGRDDVLEMCKERNRGIIYARLNCYGWQGPWAGRSGWQQISDACCGVSREYGRAMGIDEPVTPIFPNSDHLAGLAGTIGVLGALMRRAENGGSYTVDVALNYYSQWLINSVGTYPRAVWDEVWVRNGKMVFRSYQPMQYLFPAGIKLLQDNAPHVLSPDFFEERDAKAMGCKVRCVKPVLQFPGNIVRPEFQIGVRKNGTDAPKWPEDLMTEVVV